MADAEMKMFNFYDITWREPRCARQMAGEDWKNTCLVTEAASRPASPPRAMSNGKGQGKNGVPSRCANATNKTSCMVVLRSTRRGRTNCFSSARSHLAEIEQAMLSVWVKVLGPFLFEVGNNIGRLRSNCFQKLEACGLVRI